MITELALSVTTVLSFGLLYYNRNSIDLFSKYRFGTYDRLEGYVRHQDRYD